MSVSGTLDFTGPISPKMLKFALSANRQQGTTMILCLEALLGCEMNKAFYALRTVPRGALRLRERTSPSSQGADIYPAFKTRLQLQI